MSEKERDRKPAGFTREISAFTSRPLRLPGKLSLRLAPRSGPKLMPEAKSPSAAFIYLRPMRADDYRRVIAFWEDNGESVRLPADSFATIAAFLQRHPGLSIVAEKDERMLGAALCSEDGRAGYIQHFVVASGAERNAVVQVMLRRCVLQFNALGLAHCFLIAMNTTRSTELGRTAPDGLSECVAALTGSD